MIEPGIEVGFAPNWSVSAEYDIGSTELSVWWPDICTVIIVFSFERRKAGVLLASLLEN
jgi:hypothetical protein